MGGFRKFKLVLAPFLSALTCSAIKPSITTIHGIRKSKAEQINSSTSLNSKSSIFSSLQVLTTLISRKKIILFLCVFLYFQFYLRCFKLNSRVNCNFSELKYLLFIRYG